MTQLIGAVATAVWSGVATFVILKVVNVGRAAARVGRDENEGLDLVSARRERLQPLAFGRIGCAAEGKLDGDLEPTLGPIRAP